MFANITNGNAYVLSVRAALTSMENSNILTLINLNHLTLTRKNEPDFPSLLLTGRVSNR